jgi:hypothetical protein
LNSEKFSQSFPEKFCQRLQRLLQLKARGRADAKTIETLKRYQSWNSKTGGRAKLLCSV